ncbi:hypothetical protein NQ315_012139 [Exocentrus adspersus]|uniref:Uncharacterized protein n=1 Tax=Exocentrus adspersus TaxID=1586481 RepID=A0AAV8VXV8_9CUCU|nr:hypothetical protein NQ315_012139 [Exocentrus adspersus]
MANINMILNLPKPVAEMAVSKSAACDPETNRNNKLFQITLTVYFLYLGTVMIAWHNLKQYYAIIHAKEKQSKEVKPTIIDLIYTEELSKF